MCILKKKVKGMVFISVIRSTVLHDAHCLRQTASHSKSKQYKPGRNTSNQGSKPVLNRTK